MFCLWIRIERGEALLFDSREDRLLHRLNLAVDLRHQLSEFVVAMLQTSGMIGSGWAIGCQRFQSWNHRLAWRCSSQVAYYECKTFKAVNNKLNNASFSKRTINRTELWAESDRSTVESDEVPVSEFARAAESVALERILLLPLSALSFIN